MPEPGPAYAASRTPLECSTTTRNQWHLHHIEASLPARQTAIVTPRAHLSRTSPVRGQVQPYTRGYTTLMVDLEGIHLDQPLGPKRSTRTSADGQPNSTRRLLANSAKPAEPQTNVVAPAMTSGSSSPAVSRPAGRPG